MAATPRPGETGGAALSAPQLLCKAKGPKILVPVARARVPMSVLTGKLAGLQTEPAVLSFALEQAGNDLPNVGYAAVYPIATVARILLAQALLALWL